MFSDTFARIAPTSAPPIIGKQLLGLCVGVALTLALYPDTGDKADGVVRTTTDPPSKGRPVHLVAIRTR
jgi:hypothetical protein